MNDNWGVFTILIQRKKREGNPIENFWIKIAEIAWEVQLKKYALLFEASIWDILHTLTVTVNAHPLENCYEYFKNEVHNIQLFTSSSSFSHGGVLEQPKISISKEVE